MKPRGRKGGYAAKVFCLALASVFRKGIKASIFLKLIDVQRCCPYTGVMWIDENGKGLDGMSRVSR